MSARSEHAVSKFLALKLHKWRGQYQRVFSLEESNFHTLDPVTFAVTNSWSYKDIIDLRPDTQNKDEFSITFPSSGGMFGGKDTTLRFSTPHRTPLLSALHRMRCSVTNNLGRGAHHSQQANKLTRTGERRLCQISVGPSAIIISRPNSPNNLDQPTRALSHYHFKDIRQIRRCKDDDRGVIFVIHGRGRLFFC
jgi:hypothetical protein